MIDTSRTTMCKPVCLILICAVIPLGGGCTGEAPEETATDTLSDAAPSTKGSDTDLPPETGSDTDTQTASDAEADTTPAPDSEVMGATDTIHPSDADVDGDADVDTDADSDTDTDADTDTEPRSDPETDWEIDTDTDPARTIAIDAAVKHQIVQGFGASDAWNVDFVGKYWTDEQKEAIARLLFGQTMDQAGNPEGIGLSRWRFNVGGGSAEQGAASRIEEDTRRAECFLKADGTYDWTKQAGQQWFLNKAIDYGVDKLIMFSNSPPVHYTRNGLAFGDDGNNTNLASDSYDDFAAFLATVLDHFDEEGIHFEEVSPVNEPQWDWTDGQEGSTWTIGEIARLVDALDTALTARGLSTHILVPESGHYDDLHQNSGDPDKSDFIWNFFDPSRPAYVGDLRHVPPVICGHSYWTFDTDRQLVDVRTAVREEAEWAGVEVQQTEYSMLSIPEELGDDPSYFDIALFMAKVIYADLAIAHAVSWSFWTSLDRERWGHMNRYMLIQLIPPTAPDGPLQLGGTHAPRKTLWVLGNYSLFIRPGYQRIGLDGANNVAGLMGTAYLAPDTSEIAAVLVNMTRIEQKVTLRLDNLPDKSVGNTEIYVTTERDDLHRAATRPAGGSYRIPPRSVVTMRTRLLDH